MFQVESIAYISKGEIISLLKSNILAHCRCFSENETILHLEIFESKQLIIYLPPLNTFDWCRRQTDILLMA